MPKLYMMSGLTIKEQKIKQKCNELRKRIQEIEECNEISLLALSRTRASIRRSRLQYSILLERLYDRALSQSHLEGARPWLPVLFEENTISKGSSSDVDGSNARSNFNLSGTPKGPFEIFVMAESKKHDDLEDESRQEVLTNKWNSLSIEEQARFAEKYADTLSDGNVISSAHETDSKVANDSTMINTTNSRGDS